MSYADVADFTTAVAAADAAVDVVVTGLTGDTLYHVYCATNPRYHCNTKNGRRNSALGSFGD